MAVSARDLPGSRARRWAFYGGSGAVAAIASLVAISAYNAWRAEVRTIEGASAAIEENTATADRVADECGIGRFSSESELESFPMKIPDYMTKRERECLDRVTVARADLIQNYLDRKQAQIREVDAAEALRIRLWIAATLGAVFFAGLYFGEIMGRRFR